MAQAAAATTPKAAREEMWFIILAKSKTMRFFAVSCEFIIFLGCLWLTLVTILPDATGWAKGGVNNFFLIAMGFAVDAALPEAWLHVVDQYTESPRKTTQLKWSVPIAVGMLILVVANFVYTKLAGTSGAAPSGAMEGLVNTLLIARMFIGISYVTIRECQSFLDRKQAKQQPVAPVDFQQMINRAIADLQANFEQRLAAIAGDQARMLASIQQVQSSAPAINHEAICEAVTRNLEARFEARFEAAMRQKTVVSEAPEARQIEAAKKPREASHEASQRGHDASKIVTLRQASAGATDKRAAVYGLLDQGDQRSSYQLAPIIGCSAATIQRYMKDWKAEHDEAAHEAEQSAI